MTGVIDFRARANTAETATYVRPRKTAIRNMGILPFGDEDDWFDPPVETMDQYIAHLDEAGIQATVFVGRNRPDIPGWSMTNEWVAEVTGQYPDRLIGFGGVDARHPDAAPAVIEEAIELGLIGVNLDAFQVDRSPADPVFDPIYDTCSEAGVPVILTMGVMPGISAKMVNAPMALDTIAVRFPDLTVIGCHSGWPFVHEMIAVAWRHPNVYFENSFYHFAPGAEALVEAANSVIGHKMLYGSAYPFVPLKQTLDRFRTLPFEPEVATAVLGGNARRILKLEAGTGYE